jgi:hypothetical protein
VTTPITELARRLPHDAVVDADDIIAELEALGVGDGTARERYGMPSVFALGDAVLTHLQHSAHRQYAHPDVRADVRADTRAQTGTRRAPSHRAYLVTPLLRCALYVGPLAVAVAAAGLLHRVAWPVPAVTLLLGWSAAQALTGLGARLARRTGMAAATRTVAGGFAATAGLWCALVWVAPATLVGPERLLAALVGLGGLTCLATVAGALVTRAELAVIRWSLPIWLIAAVSAAGAWPPGTPEHLLLGAAIVTAAGRAYRPALTRSAPPRPAPTVTEIRQASWYAAIGAAQTGCVVLLWLSGPAGVTPPALLPLLVAVPMLEALVGWHTDQLDVGLDRVESHAGYAAHVRGVTVVTVAGLLPPLGVGLALAVAAYRLPYGLSAHDGARDLVLSLAGGTLLGGVFAATLLLAGGGRTAQAAVLAALPAVLTAVVAALPWHRPGTGLLPTVVAVLAVTLLVGLPAVARTSLDHRRTS